MEQAKPRKRKLEEERDTGHDKKRASSAKGDAQHPVEGKIPSENEHRKKKRKSHKRRKEDNGLPNPEDDDNIMSKAKDALGMAYAKMSGDPTWKFNTNLQKWLMRNVWSEITLPPQYMVLVLGFFADCRGNTREHLIAQSRKVIDEAANVDEITHAHAVRIQRAEMLLDKLSQMPAEVGPSNEMQDEATASNT